jgi:hypothetical protein
MLFHWLSIANKKHYPYLAQFLVPAEVEDLSRLARSVPSSFGVIKPYFLFVTDDQEK